MRRRLIAALILAALTVVCVSGCHVRFIVHAGPASHGPALPGAASHGSAPHGSAAGRG